MSIFYTKIGNQMFWFDGKTIHQQQVNTAGEITGKLVRGKFNK